MYKSDIYCGFSQGDPHLHMPFTLTQMITPTQTNKSAPIGIFDSGVGGLTVARAIIDQLPGESILYLGDTARGPYGSRSLAQVRSYALEIMDQLVAAGVKAIVIACNTASAAMLRDARERYSIPVIEVIQPAVRRAVSATRSGKIGVIGTTATIESKVQQLQRASAPQSSWGKVLVLARQHLVQVLQAGVAQGTSGHHLKGRRTRRKVAPRFGLSFFTHTQFVHQLSVFTVSSPKFFAQCFWIFNF